MINAMRPRDRGQISTELNFSSGDRENFRSPFFNLFTPVGYYPTYPELRGLPTGCCYWRVLVYNFDNYDDKRVPYSSGLRGP